MATPDRAPSRGSPLLSWLLLLTVLSLHLYWLGLPRAADDAEEANGSPEESISGGKLVLILLVLGSILILGVAAMFTLYRKWRSDPDKSRLPSPLPQHAYLIEALAIYFAASSLLYFLVLRHTSFGEVGPMAAGIDFVLVALAMCWPRVRGLAWSDIVRHCGWTRGAGWRTEVTIGVIAFFALFLVEIALQALGPDFAGNEHPVKAFLAGASNTTRALSGLDLMVLTPLAEESLLRGFLYKHLRDATRPMGPKRGILLSIAVVGLVFFVVHPYGWSNFLELTIFGAALCLLREWRGSLLPCIVVHSARNALAFATILAFP